MITPISLGAERCDLGTRAEVRRRAVRHRVRRLRQQVRRAIRVQRENALINYLSAKRFPRESKEAQILVLLAQNDAHRLKKLEKVLNRLSETSGTQPRSWLFDWKCFCVAYAPRLLLLRWLQHHRN